MGKQAHPELVLNSRGAELHVSPTTGKITHLKARNYELLVLPFEHERDRALSDDGRSRFESLDAWGGDECFPTVGGSSLWNIRDHGDLWARTPSVFYANDNKCFTGWNTNESQFKRTISTEPAGALQNTLGMFRFEIQFPSSTPIALADGSQRQDLNLVSAYASHALFAAEPGDRIEWSVLPPNVDLVAAAQKQHPQQILSAREFAPDGSPVASKFYMKTSADRVFVTTLIRQKLKLRIDVLQDSSLPWLGVWWCHNGWGDGRPHSTVGIEPTNVPSDGPILGLPGTDPVRELRGQFLWIISEI